MKETILVVEDEASIRNIARVYLEQENYRVICTDNGLDGMEKARNHQPDRQAQRRCSDALSVELGDRPALHDTLAKAHRSCQCPHAYTLW